MRREDVAVLEHAEPQCHFHKLHISRLNSMTKKKFPENALTSNQPNAHPQDTSSHQNVEHVSA